MAVDWTEYYRLPQEACETCGVEGCVCDWCDLCEITVNPYEHFLEWNPNGVHVSNIAWQGLEKGVL